ncbi:MAG: HlyD family efflux transporter periplasmic adaptor subunit [Armatimonadetes bacterium]|nr:HlyD family efflux transporter periplasmic adaptor subunit [Armatimonadota bacterium]MBS1728904.1 HlyD family efflux transporter periplasmic adaptor subunit [Armatimonadota bacterium]
MKKFAPLIIIAVVTIGGYFIDQSRRARDSQVSGFFETQPIRVASRVGGRVAKILVKEGDEAKTGQTLIELEADPNVASKDALAANAQQLEEQYQKIAAGSRPEEIERQAAAVDQARAALEKLKNGALPEEKQQARDRAAQAKSQYDKALHGSRPEEVRQARAVMNQALAKYQQAQRGLTQEERAQLQARLDAARTAESLAKKELDRYTKLQSEGAASVQVLQAKQAAHDQAVSQRRDAEEAVRRANLGTPKEELEQAHQAYLQAKAQFDMVQAGPRAEDIAAAKKEYDAAQSQLDLVLRGARVEDIAAAKARLDAESATLALLKAGNRKEDIAAAKAAWQAAQAQLVSSEAVVGERKIIAPKGGLIERIDIADGDLVAAGAPVVEMSDPDDIWIRVYLPEAQLAKVKVGDDATLLIDGIADPLEATVDAISHQGEFTPANLQTPNERGKQVFGIRLRLKKADPRVRAGMYATAKRIGQWP